MNKRNVRIVKKIEEILGDKELYFGEIMLAVRASDKRNLSYTHSQISNFLKRKQFEKVRFDEKASQSIWRNKNVMDRKIQTE
mgnify:CR=1 FL=1|tara:strand:- start:1071 stop:1316 length:246 start_codon:yes stop_codon:yes gene_type:complete